MYNNNNSISKRPNFTNFTEEAEWVINQINNSKNKKVKSSQIRKILALVNQMDFKLSNYHDNKINEEIKNMLLNLKIRIIYQSGRENTVKDFVTKGELLEKIGIILKNESTSELSEYIRYIEALVAYHKFTIKESETNHG